MCECHSLRLLSLISKSWFLVLAVIYMLHWACSDESLEFPSLLTSCCVCELQHKKEWINYYMLSVVEYMHVLYYVIMYVKVVEVSFTARISVHT
mmetsp:Transcript_8385/g.14223  ORF Transcript_8385/g.14223 Transcript_8385/m.14223 type:complete len:94 (-) Transcript_8385:1222-1503(-)